MYNICKPISLYMLSMMQETKRVFTLHTFVFSNLMNSSYPTHLMSHIQNPILFHIIPLL